MSPSPGTAAPPRRPLRVGLIGAGGIAGVHLDAYRRNPDAATVVAVADSNVSALEARAGELAVPGFADYGAMIRQSELDAVDICLPHHLHAEAIIRAAEAGKHILCEKPLCTSDAESEEVRRAVNRSGVTVMSGHNQVFRPVIDKARSLITSGALGDLYSASVSCTFRLDLDADSIGWRGRRSDSGGGALIDSGFHPVYLLLYLLDDEPVEVSAMLSRARLGFLDGEDTAHVLVRFAHGAVGCVTTSWAYEAADAAESIAVAGSGGAIAGNDHELVLTNGFGERETFQLEAPDTFSALVRHFADAVSQGSRPVQNEVDGARALRVVLAAYRAHESGVRQSLADTEG